MEYFLQLFTMGNPPALPIDSERFFRLKNSLAILHVALAMEQDYEMVISNYMDLERESTNITITHMVREFRGYIDSFDARTALNRHFMNLLNSVRFYKDRLTSHCSACLPNENNVAKQIGLLFSSEYDKNFDYRFMEAFRNYVQHCGPAVHQIMFGGRWTSLDTDGLLEFWSTVYAEKDLLFADGNFKKQILDEMPERVNLISCSRGYIEAISLIHNSARQIISKNISEARIMLQTALDDYRSLYQKDFAGLNAYAFDEDVKRDEVLILLNWDDIRLELVKRNGNLVNLKKRYVTGQIEKK